MAKEKLKKKKVKKIPEKVKEKIEETPEPRDYSRSLRALQTMTRKDLQRECVLRGLSFELVVSSSTPSLGSYFQENFDKTEDLKLLDEFDAWIGNELEKRGYDKDSPMRSPIFKLGLPGTPKEWGQKELKDSLKKSTESSSEPKSKKSKEDKPKEKRVKNEETGLMSGTKKSYTYDLTKAGESQSDIIKKVMEKYPEAKEASIKIWISRCKKEM